MSFGAQQRQKDRIQVEGYMTEHTFQDAYTRVRGRHSDQTWFALSQREITDSIYREMRVLDRERFIALQQDFAPMAIAAE